MQYANAATSFIYRYKLTNEEGQLPHVRQNNEYIH